MQNHTAMVHLEYKTANPYSARYTIGTLTTPLCVRSTYVMATAYSTRQPQTALPNLYDLTGQRFEHLVVQSYAYSKDENRCWNCLCDCGNTTVVTTEWLRRRKAFQHVVAVSIPESSRRHRDYRFVVLELLPGRKARCLCDCGKETLVFRTISLVAIQVRVAVCILRLYAYKASDGEDARVSLMDHDEKSLSES